MRTTFDVTRKDLALIKRSLRHSIDSGQFFFLAAERERLIKVVKKLKPIKEEKK